MPELDSRQRRAVEAGPGDLFVAAGAGSGKTRVLTARFVSAVLGEPPYSACPPETLLTVTFTEKAAGELGERIRRGLIEAGNVSAARRVSDAWISTIHGMCSRILRSHALDVGIDPRFRVLDQVEASILVNGVLDDVVGKVVGSDQAIAGLVDAYSFPGVARALTWIRADLAAAGCSVSDLRTEPVGEVLAALEALESEARELAEGFSAIKQTKTTAANAAAALALAGGVAAWLVDVRSGAGEPAGYLDGVSFRHARTIDGHAELVDAAKRLLEEVRMDMAQILVGGHERALLDLLGRFSDAYEGEKRARGVLDFEDLQTLTAWLLETRADIAASYRDRFAMLMVDEFQDTNALQLEVIRGLSSGNLCTVGDENQSIYSFRHADVEVFRARARSVDARVDLDINYRIAPPLLAALNRLFSHTAFFGERYMVLGPPPTPVTRPAWPAGVSRFDVSFVDTADSPVDPVRAEARAVAERVGRHLAAGIPRGDIAVLMGALSRGRAAAVECELAARGIPAVLAAGGAFFECPEVMEARALLKTIDNVRDDEALLTVLAGRITGLGPDTLLAVREQADHLWRDPEGLGRRPCLWEALPGVVDGLPREEREALERTIAVVEKARRMQGVRPLAETVLEPLLDLEMDIALFGDGRGGARAWANVMKLVGMADDFESVSTGGLGGFLRHLDQREEHSTGEQEATLDGEGDAVRIMSIHAAKGLEFPVVVVCSLTGDGSAPAVGTARIDGYPLLGMSLPTASGSQPTRAWRRVADARSAVRDAERLRLFYVACTRAREGLSVVCRIRADRAADGSIPGILRGVFGLAEPVGPVCESVSLGDGAPVEVSVIRPGEDVAASVEDAARQAAPASPHAGVASYTGGGENMGGGTSEEVAVAPRSGQGAAVPPASYTSLAAYERCPYHYYLTRVVRLMPVSRAGVTAALDLGSALHAVLQRAHDDDGFAEAFEQAVRATRLDGPSAEAVERAARTFLASPLAGRVRAAEPVIREAPFLVPLTGTVLSGAMDLIAWNGSRALVVDYKTGGSTLAEDEARERYSLQAGCYALAAINAGASAVEVVFAELERDRTIGFEFSESGRDGLVARIERLVEGIAAARYQPLETYVPGLCDTCPGFGGLCPVKRPGRGASG